ncbi:MAG: ECF transporter S component [Erysipelotrichaceae bacterium]|nr:ECF transporter S component [Erysipelotrichaceae bacterium]MDD3810276.1 ECF transporter S component [Erysipelotrichaceae bacterium]
MKTKDLSLSALFIALIIIATAFIHVPSGLANGYIHFGDSMIFLAIMFIPNYRGVFVGGLGSMLSDVVAGYAFFAPLTFVVKMLMGLVFFLVIRKNPENRMQRITGFVFAGIVLVSGYFIGEYFMYNSVAIPLTEVLGNTVQVIGSVVIFEIVYNILKRTGIKEKIGE